MFKFLEIYKIQKEAKYIKDYVDDDYIEKLNIDNSDDVTKLIITTREYYEKWAEKKSNEDLKTKLIELECKKIGINESDNISEVGIMISATLTFLGISTSIILSVGSVIFKNTDNDFSSQVLDFYHSQLMITGIVLVFLVIYLSISGVVKNINHANCRNNNIALNIHISLIKEILESYDDKNKNKNIAENKEESLLRNLYLKLIR